MGDIWLVGLQQQPLAEKKQQLETQKLKLCSMLTAKPAKPANAPPSVEATKNDWSTISRTRTWGTQRPQPFNSGHELNRGSGSSECIHGAECMNPKCVYGHPQPERDQNLRRVKESRVARDANMCRTQPPDTTNFRHRFLTLCKHINSKTGCKHGDSCRYPHNLYEKEQWQLWAEKNFTRGRSTKLYPDQEAVMCRNCSCYTGLEIPCGYGMKCHFAHSERELTEWN